MYSFYLLLLFLSLHAKFISGINKKKGEQKQNKTKRKLAEKWTAILSRCQIGHNLLNIIDVVTINRRNYGRSDGASKTEYMKNSPMNRRTNYLEFKLNFIEHEFDSDFNDHANASLS